MAKTFEKLLEQKPGFIVQGEPISGSSNPTIQDATVLEDGTIISTLEGVNNRTPAHLWGQIKLLVDILRKQHESDGTHKLSSNAIANLADIDESKLKLDLTNIDKPDGSGKFTSTSELADYVSELWPVLDSAAVSSYFSTNNANNIISSVQPSVPVFFSNISAQNELTNVGGLEDACLIGRGEELTVGGNKIHLSNVNSNSSDCIISIGKSQGFSSTPVNISPTQIIVLEVWNHNITSSGIGFYNGNIHYKNTDIDDGSEGLSYPHTSEFVPLSSNNFKDFLFNLDNNIFLDRDYNFIQRVWGVNVKFFDYATYKNGCDDPTYRTYYGNKPVTKSDVYAGCWESIDKEVLLVPIMMVARRNAGVYHKFLNPAGQADIRTNQVVNSFSDCFYRDYIKYADESGAECPDYISSVYHMDSDTFTLNNVYYYRSGTINTLSRKSYIPNSRIEDIIPEYDIISLKRSYVSVEEALYSTEQLILSGNTMAIEFRSIEYGKTSDIKKSTFFSKKPPQSLGFGTSEVVTFGSGNLGGVLVDICNNDLTGLIDGVRNQWIDKPNSTAVCFNLVQGNSSSESKPNLLAYNPVSRLVVLNTNNLSGTPTIDSNYIPTMVWETGESVVLESNWTGIGSYTASVIIDNLDHSSHLGQKLYGQCNLSYGKGAGVPYVLNNIASISGTNVNYNWFYTEEKQDYLSFTYDGQVVAATTTVLSLNGFTFNRANYYKDLYLTVVSTGETRKILSYNNLTSEVTLVTGLSAAPDDGSRVVIHTININTQPYLHIDRLGRGILGNVVRSNLKAVGVTIGGNRVGVIRLTSVIHKVSVGSLGSTPVVKGSIITGLLENEYVNIIHESDTTFEQGFVITFELSKSNNLFKRINTSDTYKIVGVGSLFSTNVGSVNRPECAYREFIPCATIPEVGGVKWVGSTNSKLISSIINMKNISWAQVSPFEGMILKASNMAVQFKYFVDDASLVSIAQVANKNSGCHVGFMLAKSQLSKGLVLLLSINYNKNFGFYSADTVFTVDINKIFVVKE